jgi:hypothetical protein
MKIASMLDVICATHMSSLVECPFDGLGGLMLVAAPEALKTSILRVLKEYPSALLLTDVNTQTLVRMRDRIAGGEVRSLVMLDLQKIYERDGDTARNVEGTLRAMASEGFSAASFQSQEINRVTARCVVMGALTQDLMEKKFEGWKSSGFARRFLFPTFRLEDPEMLTDAIVNWEKIDLGRSFIPPPANRRIPMLVTKTERSKLRAFVLHQYGKTEPFQMLIKVYCVLKWHYGQRNGKPKHYAWDIVEDFSTSLGRDGAKLTFDHLKTNGKKGGNE